MIFENANTINYFAAQDMKKKMDRGVIKTYNSLWGPQLWNSLSLEASNNPILDIFWKNCKNLSTWENV